MSPTSYRAAPPRSLIIGRGSGQGQTSPAGTAGVSIPPGIGPGIGSGTGACKALNPPTAWIRSQHRRLSPAPQAGRTGSRFRLILQAIQRSVCLYPCLCRYLNKLMMEDRTARNRGASNFQLPVMQAETADFTRCRPELFLKKLRLNVSASRSRRGGRLAGRSRLHASSGSPASRFMTCAPRRVCAAEAPEDFALRMSAGGWKVDEV